MAPCYGVSSAYKYSEPIINWTSFVHTYIRPENDVGSHAAITSPLIINDEHNS